MFQTNPEHENKIIRNLYRKILKSLAHPPDREELAFLRRAFYFARDAHSKTRRKNGDPYIYHPLEVALICTEEIGLGVSSVASAFLHDVVEDTDFTVEQIGEHFGEKVQYIVDGLTKIKDIPEIESPSEQAETFRKLIISLSTDVRVILLKLADRLHNMRTLEFMIPEKQKKIASETMFLYAPLAHRLGLYRIKSDLEDLALKYLEPEVHASISEKLKITETDREEFILEFMRPIKESLEREGLAYEISSREKSIRSIWTKMKEKDVSLEEIFDLFAVRIILDTPLREERHTCWKAYSVVTEIYRPRHDRLRDWISTPKANGYESLHTTVMSFTGQWVEVQIRTQRMHEIAEKGYAAHWKYKNDDNGDQGLTSLDRYLIRIRDLLQNPESDALSFLDDFKLNLFTDEIFVYTPKGELRTLPVNASVLDFAYAIHTEIGRYCMAGKVNHRLSPPRHKLSSGDQIEIITSKNVKPSEEWLDWVVTARAKMQIRDALREDKRSYGEKGKKTLESFFKNLNLDFSRANVSKFMEFNGVRSPVDLYYLVATGKITQNEVKACCLEHQKANWFDRLNPFSKSKPHEPKSLRAEINEKIKSKPEAFLIGGDLETIKFNISGCCSPIQGDDVVGFINLTGNIDIHRTSCEQATQLSATYGNRIVKTKWRSSDAIAFLAGLKIVGLDRPGLLLEIVNLMYEKYKINIKSFMLDSSGQVWQANMMIYVSDTTMLQAVSNDLKKIKDIRSVSRIDRLKGQD